MKSHGWLHSQNGMTLIELLVAAALSSLVLVALGMVTQAMYSAKRDMETFDAEKDVFRAEYLIRSVLSTAIDVRSRSSSGGASATAGWVNTDFSATEGAGTQPVGVFRREIRAFPHPNPGATGSDSPFEQPAANRTTQFVQSGLFYIPPRGPVGTEPYKAGMLFVDMGNPNSPTANIQGDYSDEIIGNLVSFRTEEPKTAYGTDTLLNFRVRFVYRRFMQTGMEKRKCFLISGCPGATGNPPTEEFIDTERSFRVMILNADLGQSVLDPGSDTRERTLGRIYFFRMLNPFNVGGG